MLLSYLRLIIFLHVIAPRSVMCCFMLICQCCFAIVKVLLKKVTYLLCTRRKTRCTRDRHFFCK